jgi:predicted RNA-binding Zn ribbon-like protein
MASAHQFPFLGGHVCVDFVNTVDWRDDPDRTRDRLETPDAFRCWARQAGLLDARNTEVSQGMAEQRAFGRACRLREHLHSILVALIEGGRPSAADLDPVALEVARAVRHRRLATEGKWLRWEWRPELSDLNRVLATLANAAAELLTSQQLPEVKRCAGHGCGWLFLDTSKNHSRRWCDMQICGNRAKAHRHYHAHRT